MGVTGLVRSILFRNKSFGAHDYSNGEKKRWSSVRSYLCGDEINSLLAVDDSGSSLLTMSQQQLSSDPCDSVLAIQDSASVKHLWEREEDESVSVKSSEATVTQPSQEKKSKLVQEDLDSQSQATTKTTPMSTLFLQKKDAAAVTIQSAFRSYLAIRKEEGGKLSAGTSLQVETGNSPFYRRKRASSNQHKNKTQALKMKQDWDDSTVSSTISRLRTQSRIEAMTKRERALAYAFSQQLRICSKKTQIDPSSKDESNIGWSWLERWMATRVYQTAFRFNPEQRIDILV